MSLNFVPICKDELLAQQHVKKIITISTNVFVYVEHHDFSCRYLQKADGSNIGTPCGVAWLGISAFGLVSIV